MQVHFSFRFPNGQADFLNTFFIVNCPNTPRYANNANKLKENDFQINKSMINNTCLSSICYNLFRAGQKLCQAS